MRKGKSKKGLYFIQLNLQEEKHKALIEWIKNQADINEQSLSSFCIKIIKERMSKEIKDGYGK